jgi:hypothetical protein
MRTTDETPGDSGDIRAAQARGTTGSRQPGTKVVDLAGVRHARRAAEWGKAKYAGSWAEDLRHRLDVPPQPPRSSSCTSGCSTSLPAG